MVSKAVSELNKVAGALIRNGRRVRERNSGWSSNQEKEKIPGEKLRSSFP